MLLDLSESLACPRCGPPQGIIVLVERMEGRRVLDGRLDCPDCEARYVLRDGVVEFDVAPDSDLRVPPADPEDAVTVAALLGIQHGRGLIVVGSGLGQAAEQISSLCGGCEVVRLEPDGLSSDSIQSAERGPELGRGEVTPLLGVPSGSIPLLSGKALGVAVEGGAQDLLAEAARVLVPGGRVAVIRPGPGAATVLESLPFELLAADPRAMVARRI
jgi:uncharacterized protein YbaR (Trm112 family)